MASGLSSGIGIDLKALNWGDVLDNLIDEEALKEALFEVGDEMENEIINNFEDREPGWKALAVSTIRQRKAQGFPAGPALLRSGTLKENAAANREVEINGTEVSIAVFPAEATAPYGDVPITEYIEALDAVRSFYDFTDEQSEKIFDILEEKIAEKLGFI